jgi:hypothetical protein
MSLGNMENEHYQSLRSRLGRWQACEAGEIESSSVGALLWGGKEGVLL